MARLSGPALAKYRLPACVREQGGREGGREGERERERVERASE